MPQTMAIFDQATRGFRAYVALAVLVLLASLPGLVSLPTLDRDEARFAEASAEMMESGDFVVIRYHDELRNKKPVGIHWLQAATVSATSNVVARDIAAYRLASLLAAIAAVWATLWAGSALLPRRAAVIGAALFGSTLLLTTEAHIAKTDAALCAAITIAMAALARMRMRAFDPKSNAHARGRLEWWTRDGRADGIVFWAAMGCAILIKGPIGPMVVGLSALSIQLWERHWTPGAIRNFLLAALAGGAVALVGAMSKLTPLTLVGAAIVSLACAAAFVRVKPGAGWRWIAPLAFWPGLSLVCVMVLPWFFAVEIATRGAFLHEAVSVDLGGKIAGGAEGHSAPFGSHLLALPLLFWPATIVLLPGLMLLARAFRASAPVAPEPVEPGADRQRAGWLFLAAWIIPSWFAFEATPTKLLHYTLPLYPALALACGAAMELWIAGSARRRVDWGSVAAFAAIALALAAVTTTPALESLRGPIAHKYTAANAARVLQDWNLEWRKTGVGWWPFLLIAAAACGTVYAFYRRLPVFVLAGVLGSAVVFGFCYRALVLPNQAWMLPTRAAIAALAEVCGLPEGTQRRQESGCIGPGPTVVRAMQYAEPSLTFALADKVTLPPKTSATLPAPTEDPRPAWLIDIRDEAGASALRSVLKQAADSDRCVRLARRPVYNYSNGDRSLLVAAVVEPGGCNDEGAAVPVAPPAELRRKLK